MAVYLSKMPATMVGSTPSGCMLPLFYIDNNVNISSPCSKTVHTKFTKPLILRGRHGPPV